MLSCGTGGTGAWRTAPVCSDLQRCEISISSNSMGASICTYNRYPQHVPRLPLSFSIPLSLSLSLPLSLFKVGLSLQNPGEWQSSPPSGTSSFCASSFFISSALAPLCSSWETLSAYHKSQIISARAKGTAWLLRDARFILNTSNRFTLHVF